MLRIFWIRGFVPTNAGLAVLCVSLAFFQARCLERVVVKFIGKFFSIS